MRQARETPGHGRGRGRLAARERLAHVGLDDRESHVERFDAGVAEPDEPVSEIKGVGLLGLLAVVITPKERGGELAGELGILKRLLAAGDLQEALGRAHGERSGVHRGERLRTAADRRVRYSSEHAEFARRWSHDSQCSC
jgi:hypothetical protein